MALEEIATINQGVLYDKIDYASGSGSYNFFGNTVASSGFETTNLVTNNEPNTLKFVVLAVELGAELGGGGVPENINNVWQYTYVQVQQPAFSNVVLRLPARLLSARVAVQGFDNRATGATRFGVAPYSNGEVYGLLREITLLKSQRFAGQIVSDKNAASIQLTENLQITLALHGREGDLIPVQ